MRRLPFLALILLSLTGGSTGVAIAEVILAPNLGPFEGNSASGIPFFTSPNRYQQVIAASEFISQGVSGPVIITDMGFRTDSDTVGTVSTVIADIEIKLSTTSKVPDGLSAVFADNVGPDALTVFNGALALTSTGVGPPPPTPNPVDAIVSFATPFLYNPTAGNLLLEVFNQSGSSATWFFDAQSTLADSVSRLVGASPTATVGAADTLGLVIKIVAAPVPEPGTVLLLGSGLAAGIGTMVRARCKRS